MNIKFTVLCLAVFLSGCAIEPTPLNRADGQQGFTMNCNSGLEKCNQKSAELCPAGYDIIEHSKKASTVVPHYGEYPMTIKTESLTIKCK
ncbi:MAG: hypothetical protein MUQ51_06935 [Pseudomonadota bacterium]|nr:hypothetical protein [Pseudomonadota bacterium]MDO7711334.1 hypothetical protein [Pseudomonadota bacterium]